jgi:hypothetical protein
MIQHKDTNIVEIPRPQEQEPWHKPTLKKLSVPKDTLGAQNPGQDAVAALT